MLPLRTFEWFMKTQRLILLKMIILKQKFLNGPFQDCIFAFLLMQKMLNKH